MRTFARLPAGVVLIALLAACGGTDAQPADAASAGGDGVEADARTHVDGTGASVAIPVAPQRVLALSEVDLDATLALGATPAGACAGRGQDGFPRYLRERCADVTLVGALYRPSIEQVVMAEPDLILYGGWADEGVLDQLRAVAPLVRTYGQTGDWRDALAQVAAALGREAEAQAFVAGYDERAAELRARIGDGRSASIVRWNPKGPVFMHVDSFARGVLDDLGLVCPEAQRIPGPAHSQPLSFEELELIEADLIFVGTLSGGGEAQQALEAARTNPAVAQLAGRLVEVDGSLWTSAGGPLAALEILDDVAASLDAPGDAPASP